MYSRFLLTVTLACTVFWAISHTRCHAQRNVTWIGGNGDWNHDPNWIPLLPDGQPLQPFDADAVFIPSGTPVIMSLEGINTLDVDAGAGIANNGVLSVHNGVVNDGVITLGTDGQMLVNAGALAGTGEVVLADSTDTNATLQGASFGHTPCCVTHGATHTIRGEGTIFGKIVNDGLIRGEETSGDDSAVLTISGSMTNNGVIRSSATGTILLESVALTMGATGEFIADGQSILLSGATTITGGSIDAINGAKFIRRADAGGTTVFSGVTINGDFDVMVNNAGVSGVGAGITNNGTMTIDNMGVANGQLHMDTGSTLDGTGQVILNRSNNSTHISGNFMHGASHTIRGAGRIQANIVNHGSIIAEPKIDGALLRVLSGPITNNNLMQANDGATLRLEFQVAVTQGSAGRIRAADGGRVELRDQATIIGGKLQTAGTGLIVDVSSSVLNNVTNEGEFHVQAGSTTRVNTSLVNNGTITVNPTGVASLTALEFSSDTVLSGTGTIVLNQTLNGARITSAQSNQDITQAAGHTIRGAGWLNNGWFGDGRFINHGHLEGNSAAEPLEISTRLSGSGTLKNVLIGGFGASHTLGDAGTTAIVPAEGLYSFGAGSSMLADLAGTTPGTGYDQLNSTGPITISNVATQLEVSLAGGFFPTVGQSFTVLTTTDVLTGNFGAVVQQTLPVGLSWTQSQTSTSLSISLTGSIAADFDDDGDVDGDDLAIWQNGYGTGTLHEEGNADGDSDVDGRDFLIWQRSYGWGVAPPLAIAAVPEPGGFVLAFTACVVGVCRRSRVPCWPARTNAVRVPARYSQTRPNR
jgi:hypothetical protein